MESPAFNDNGIIQINPIPIQKLLLERELANELLDIGIESSSDIWVLALAEIVSLHPLFSNYLHRISSDIGIQMGLPDLAEYKTKLEQRSFQCKDELEELFFKSEFKAFQENTTIKLTLFMVIPPSYKIYWEISGLTNNLLEGSSQPITNSEGVRQLIAYFKKELRENQFQLVNYSNPAIVSWDNILNRYTIDVFTDWIGSIKNRHYHGGILIDRMGLISGERKTLEEVGRKYDITRERIRQIVNKVLKQLTHPTRRQRLNPYILYFNKLFKNNYEIMTLDEVTSAMRGLVDFKQYDSRAVTELLLYCSGKYIPIAYNFVAGSGGSDIGSVIWHSKNINPEQITEARTNATKIVENDPLKYQYNELINKTSEECDIPYEIVEASLRTYPKIEQDSDGFMAISGKAKYLTTTRMILNIMREIGIPSHFTVIAERFNAKYPERYIIPDSVHNRLVENPLFRWVDRGTYGLPEWGLPEIKPKESYKASKKLMRSIIKRIGKPASIQEIKDMLNTTIATNPDLIFLSTPQIILCNNPQLFVPLGGGIWGLKEWGIAPRLIRSKSTIQLVLEILSNDETDWLTIQQLYIEMKERGWNEPIRKLQTALDNEGYKPKSRITKRNLSEFNLRFYGLSSSIWNAEYVLQKLLSD